MTALNYIHDLKGRLMSEKQEIVKEAAKAAPAFLATFWNWLSTIPLEKWQTAVVIGYTLIQAWYFVRDRRKQRRGRK